MKLLRCRCVVGLPHCGESGERIAGKEGSGHPQKAISAGGG
jgi:hypothetical protein